MKRYWFYTKTGGCTFFEGKNVAEAVREFMADGLWGRRWPELEDIKVERNVIKTEEESL